MLRRFTGTFFAGFFALLPLLITLGVVTFLAAKLNAWLGPASFYGGWMHAISRRWNIPVELSYVVCLVIVVLLIWTVGYFARQYIGQRIGSWFEAVICRLPFINKVYSSADQVVDLFRKKEDDVAAALSNVVLVRIANTRILGMLASADPVTIHGVPHFLVYFPSSPVPATGFNYFVPCEDVDDVDVSVEEMTRVIVSLGSLGPGIMNAKSPLILPSSNDGRKSTPAPAAEQPDP